jgi:transposase
MEYPAALLEKAQRLEQLLHRVAAGEPLDEANETLGFRLDRRQLARWQAKYEAAGGQWQALIDGRQGHPRTASSAVREWLYARKEEDEELRAPHLAIEIKEQFGVELSAGHINYLLRKRGLTAPPGRYKKQLPAQDTPTIASDSGESVDNAGLFFP